MQSPNPHTPEKVVNLPKPAPAEERRYDFTPPQIELIQAYLVKANAAEKEMTEAKTVVSVFMSYLQKENNLPSDVNWSLAADKQGRPYMRSAIPNEK